MKYLPPGCKPINGKRVKFKMWTIQDLAPGCKPINGSRVKIQAFNSE